MTAVEALRSMPLFAGLTVDQLDGMLSLARRKRASAGTVILHEGDRGDSLYILASGSVEVTKRLGLVIADGKDEHREKTLIHLTAPQFFGEMALLGNAERSATITAHGDCELLEISRADFEQLVESDYHLGYCVVRNIAIVLTSRLRRTDQEVLKLTVALSLALGNR